MLQDITEDMGDELDVDDASTPTDDSGTLTKDQVLELATMQPLLVYEQVEDKKVKVAVLEGVRTFHHPTESGKPPRFSIRIQGVRKGELTYKANRTINELPLVPVLCLMDADLVDRMRVSPEALGLGKAAIDSLNPAPVTREFVDMVVEDYVEATIEREFFLPSEGGDDYADTLPIVGNTSDMPSVEEVMAALGPTSNPNFTGNITFGGYVQEQTPVNTQELSTVEQVIPEPALIEDGDATVHVSDNLDATAYQSPEALSTHPDLSPSSDLVDMAVEPMAVPGKGAVAYSVDAMGLPVIETEPNYPGQYSEPLPAVGVITTAEWQGAAVSLEPGVQEDGTTVPFDPAVHELPM